MTAKKASYGDWYHMRAISTVSGVIANGNIEIL